MSNDSLPDLRHLVITLEAMDQDLERLHALLAEEQQAIRTLMLDRLGTLTSQKQELLNHIQQHEQRRVELTGALAQKWVVAAETEDPSRYQGAVTEASAAALQRQQEKLTARVLRIQESNRFNASLLAQSLEFLRSSLRFWQHRTLDPTLYSEAGTAVTRQTVAVDVRG